MHSFYIKDYTFTSGLFVNVSGPFQMAILILNDKKGVIRFESDSYSLT